MPAALESSLPELYSVVLQKLRARMDGTRLTLVGTHPRTSLMARIGKGDRLAPPIVLAFAHEGTDATGPARIHLRMEPTGALLQCDADGTVMPEATVHASRSLIGRRTFLHLHGLPWRPMENHDVSEHVQLRPLVAPIEQRTHTLREMEPETSTAPRVAALRRA